MKLPKPIQAVIHTLHQQPFEFRTIYYYELILFSVMYATVPLFAFGYQPYTLDFIIIVVFSILTLQSGYFAALIWNDINDADIDRVVHPDRILPRKKISSRQFFGIALIFSFLTFLFSVLINIWCFLVVGFAALFVAIHDKFLKRNVNIPAFSEIVTPVQWVVVPIFGFVAVWSFLSTASSNQLIPFIDYLSWSNPGFQQMILLVLFTYFADDAHDIAEGIHDVDGDIRFNIPTYSTSFGIHRASIISFFMYVISGVFILILFFISLLSLFFLLPFLLLWVYVLYHSYQLVKVRGEEKKKMGSKVGQKGFDFLLLTYAFIFIDLLIHLFIL